MFTRKPMDLPTAEFGEGSSEERLARLESEHRRLLEALLVDREGLNKEGVLDIADAAITATKGIKFPATAVNQTDVNTLDDYEEGTWTPVLTFATVGDLSVVYNVQLGTYTKIGRRVFADFNISTTTFTHTTAASELVMTGLPFAANATSNYVAAGSAWFNNIDFPAGYSHMTPGVIAGESRIRFILTGDNATALDATVTHAPTGVQKVIRGSVSYIV